MSREKLIKGRGAQVNPTERFSASEYGNWFPEGIDDFSFAYSPTQYFQDNPKQIITTNNSPDLNFGHSLNPYQGCEHGCVYCYARNSHEYWGCGPGLDFERKIFIKRNAVSLLEKEFNRVGYIPQTIFMSGNTDCYQPVERKTKLTRALLSVFLKYRHPVALITKNDLILRDIDILHELAKLNLVRVAISINSLKEEIRQKLEPRTVTASRRLQVIRALANAGIPVMLMCAPVIPGLNSSEIPAVIQEAANNGATHASYTIVRLNGAVEVIFQDWVQKAYPHSAEKIINGIKAFHGGHLNDSEWGSRIKGRGNEADSIEQLFKMAKMRYMGERPEPELRKDLFIPKNGFQLSLFGD